MFTVFRRFTEEIFAALISVIFIIEAITAVVKLYTEPPPGSSDDQSAAFLGTMLCFGTYGLAMQLRSIKVSFFSYFRDCMGNWCDVVFCFTARG